MNRKHHVENIQYIAKPKSAFENNFQPRSFKDHEYELYSVMWRFDRKVPRKIKITSFSNH